MTLRVLVADDRAPFRAAARSVLRTAAGFEVVGEARSGEEAIVLAGSLRPDLVLMDIRMAGIGGIEATRRIVTAQPETVTVLVSTYRAEDLPLEARSCGAAAYVNKADFESGLLRAIYDSRSER
jgi:two-component system invasion response regulator UvrY